MKTRREKSLGLVIAYVHAVGLFLFGGRDLSHENSMQRATIIWKGKVPGTSPFNLNQCEFIRRLDDHTDVDINFQKSPSACLFSTRWTKDVSHLIAFSDPITCCCASTNRSCHEYPLGTELSKKCDLRCQGHGYSRLRDYQHNICPEAAPTELEKAGL